MNDKRDYVLGPIIATVAILGLIVCGIFLAHQNLRITDVLESQQELNDRLSLELDSVKDQLNTQAQLTAHVREESAALGAQLTSLSRYISRVVAAGEDEEALAAVELKLPPALLASGIYILDADTTGDIDDEAAAYTLYHLAATVTAADREIAFQFGVARSGFLGWQLYFDYNNDGEVDTDMVREFAASMPFGSSISGSLDPDRSQALYDRFLRLSGEAEYIPPERIEEQSGEIAQGMWSFVTDRSSQLANWIWNRSAVEADTAAEQQPVE